ncbi:MAG TPA: FAD-dependent oxidoreductase [Terriglobia bacterium]|nr:FAD-dependent oxidoreductase [Terriglobia bacterium]
MNQKIHHAILKKARESSDRTRHLELETSDGAGFHFAAGQFISIHMEWNGNRYARAYSIASALRPDRRFELCMREAPDDPATAWLDGLREGDSIEFTGPFGYFKLREPPDAVSAFVATGTGIAPIRAMIQQFHARPAGGEAWLIFGVRHEEDILYREELEALEHENPNFHFVPTLSRAEPGWTGHRGYVQAHVEKYLAAKKGLHVYVCGAPQMVQEVRQVLASMGYTHESVSYEKYE